MNVVLRHLLFGVLMCDVTPTPLARAYLAPNQVLCAKTLFSFAYMRKMLSTRCRDLMVADNIEHVPGLARFVPLFQITRHRCELAMAALPLRRAHSRGVRSTCCASLSYCSAEFSASWKCATLPCIYGTPKMAPLASA